MRISVDGWDPSFAEPGERIGNGGAVRLDPDVEVPARDWAPRSPVAGPPDPARIMLVDGVRRLDARVEIEADDQPPVPGLCASYAAGVVTCDRAGSTARVSASRVDRGLFAPAADTGLSVGTAAYRPHRVAATEPGDLINAVQRAMAELEIAVAAEAEPGDGDLVIVDGALRGRTHLPGTVGFVKSHQRRYLSQELSPVVDALAAGQRTPVFRLGTSWERHTWYLRLPGGKATGWAGIARLEAAADLDVATVVGLADASTAVLPKLASLPHKDPRAPQNLTPIAGLERRLKAMLGDPRLLLRGLRTAAATTGAV